MRDKPVGGKTKNPGSPLAAYQRAKRATTYGPTGGAQPTPSGRRAANAGRPKVNAGSPTAAAERQKRATTYGPTGGAQPRPTRGAGAPARYLGASGSEGPKRGMTAGRAMGAGAGSEGPKKQAPKYGPTGGAQPRPVRKAGRGVQDVVRPVRGAGRGADDRPRPVRGAGRSNPKPKTDQQLIAEQRTLKAKLKGVDFDALGRLMAAKGYGAYGRKAAGKKTIPKTK